MEKARALTLWDFWWQIRKSTKQGIYDYKCYEYLKLILWPVAPLQEFPTENNGMEGKVGSTEKSEASWVTRLFWEATKVGRVGGCLAPGTSIRQSLHL